MIRRFLYFAVGFVFAAFAVISFADTIPKQTLYGYTGKPNTFSTASAAAAAAYLEIDPGTGYTKDSGPYVSGTNCTGTSFSVVSIVAYYAKNFYGLSCRNSGFTITSSLGCPEGYTPDANGTTCTKPDTSCPMYPPSTPDSLPATQPSTCQCPSGTQWYAGNGCRKTCDSSQPTGGFANAGFGIAIADGASEACFQGCLVQHQAGGFDQYKGYKVATATWAKWACKGTGLGAAPTPDGKPEPDAQTQDPSKKKDPPCAAGEGVITSSSGGVKCLPEGTPNTSKPSVEKKQKTETFPDNTTKTTTETTTRDPNTNATSVSVTTTSTGGQSGPAGTSTSQEGTTGKVGGGNGDGDGDGSCDPTLNFCGGPSTADLYKKKDKTMDSVLTKFKDDVANTDFAKGAGQFFNVTIPAGSCGGMSVNVAYLNTTVDVGQYICSPQAAQLLEGVGAVLRVVVAFLAFTWAFL